MSDEFTNRARPLFPCLDLLMLVIIALFVSWTAAACISGRSVPFEDAAMLMRYSQHIAQGFGIVYNIGDRPVDGGTDFLFMLLLAGVSKTGLSLEHSVQLIGIVSHLLTAWIVFLAVRFPIKGGSWLGLAAALAFSLGPGLYYVALYFGTPLFALFSALSWLFALMLIVPPVRHDSRLSACFALSCLLMSLTRPEGVFLSIFMVCSVISYRSWKSSRLVRLWFFWVFLILGGAYFLWRWHYFGYPLPNPFYKKGGGHFHLDALQASIENTITFVNAYLVIIFLGILTVGTRKRTMFCLMPITAFTCLWVLMSNEMNHLYRFQYAIFPIINMSWPFIVVGLINQEFVQKLWNRQIVKFSGVTLAVLFFCFFSLRLHRYFENEAHSLMFQDPNYTVARSLKRFADLNYTMAVSEGGVLPLYSGWRCTDMWGLNDIWITHHGGVTSDYLNRSRPELIMFHAPLHAERPLRFSVNEDWWNLGKPWCSMVQVASQYANIKRYELVACKLDHDQNHAYYYFIKRDLKYKTLISQQIQGALCSSGEKCE